MAVEKLAKQSYCASCEEQVDPDNHVVIDGHVLCPECAEDDDDCFEDEQADQDEADEDDDSDEDEDDDSDEDEEDFEDDDDDE